MKRVIGIALSAVAFLALVNCASAETTSDTVTSSTEDTKQHSSEIAETETGSSIIAIEESSADTEPTGKDEEIYYFDDADYMVNGLAVHFDSITLKRCDKPAGYNVFVSYQVENQNDTDATFAFSSLNGNYFEVD